MLDSAAEDKSRSEERGGEGNPRPHQQEGQVEEEPAMRGKVVTGNP